MVTRDMTEIYARLPRERSAHKCTHVLLGKNFRKPGAGLKVKKQGCMVTSILVL